MMGGTRWLVWDNHGLETFRPHAILENGDYIYDLENHVE